MKPSTSNRPCRIAIIGSSGSGKSTFAEACVRLGYARLELDALMHQADWAPLDESIMRDRIAEFLAQNERWVVDGNYGQFRELIWGCADAIVWLDLPRSAIMRQLIPRTLRRVLRREELWNGNRERWTNLFSRDPEESVIAWSWVYFEEYRARYQRLMRSEWSHLRWLRLRTPEQTHEILTWLESRSS